MSNYSYLEGTNTRTAYPRQSKKHGKGYETIVCDVGCVPLLWLGLFRAEDIVRTTFGKGRLADPVEGPVAARGAAIEQLEEAVPYFEEVFRKEGPLAEYAAFLRRVLEEVTWRYLTIDLEEIATLVEDRQEYFDEVRAALAGIGQDTSAKARKRLVKLAQLRRLKRFPPARLVVDELDGKDDDHWNHCRVIGAGQDNAGIGRRVPWE